MTPFLVLLPKILPLYFLVLIGAIVARVFPVKRETLATLMIYTVTPVIVFWGALTAPLQPALLALPPLFFLGCSLIGVLALWGATRIWGKRSPHAHILAFSCGSGNTGYFGLPLILALHGEAAVSIAIFGLMGFVFYENTVGFYIAARGRHSGRESLRRVLRLPSVYAFALGVGLNILGVGVAAASPGPWRDLAQSYRGAYTVFGMMLVGVGLGQTKAAHWDLKFISFACLGKFVAWPALVLTAIFVDRTWLGVFPAEAHVVAFLLSIVPLPANGVAVASELDVEPERIAVATLASTLLALAVIPAYLACFSDLN